MNCQEVRDQLHPYIDGELEPSLAQRVERALEDCPECQAELEEMQAVRLMARAALEGPVAEVDLSQVVGNVMERLESEGALRRHAPSEKHTEKEGLGAWLVSLFNFEQPLMSLAALALVLVAVAAIAFNASPSADSNATQIASPSELKSPTESLAKSAPALPAVERLSGAALEASRHEAFVEHVEAAKGRVVVDDNADDPSTPMVVWHHVEEGVPAPVLDSAPGQEL